MNQIVRRPAADRDLLDIFRYYARNAGLRIADRFFAEAEATFIRLASMPGLGARYEPDEPLHADLRSFPVSHFRLYIVFYRALSDGIEVFRVLHGAREIHGILAEDFDIDGDVDDNLANQ